MLIQCILWSVCASSMAAAAAGPIPQSVIANAHEDIAPALCLVKYTFEVPNPNTGEPVTNTGESLGLIVSPEGLVMVRGHVKLPGIEPGQFRVVSGQGPEKAEYEARVLGKPGGINVFFLQIGLPEAERDAHFPHVAFNTSGTLELGDHVLILGMFGDSLNNTPAIQVRQIAAVLTGPRRTYCLDMPLPQGFIGGPCLDATGRVAGVVGYDLTPAQGGGLHTRSDHPLLYQSALLTKHIQQPPVPGEGEEPSDDAWLGVFTQPLTDSLAAYWGLPADGGVVVSTLMPGSPAEEAGLERGDVITKINNTPLGIKEDRGVLMFTRMVREAGAGTRIDLEVLRDAHPRTVQVTLGSRPKAAGEAAQYEDSVFGITVNELTTDVRILLNLPENTEGVIIRRVQSGSAAGLAGLRPGTIILNLGGHCVETIGDYKEAVAALAGERPAEVAVFCQIGQQTGYFRMEPQWGEHD